MTYVSIHDKGADKVVRQMTPSANDVGLGVILQIPHTLLRIHTDGLGGSDVGVEVADELVVIVTRLSL